MPKKPQFASEDIVMAALDLVREKGLAGLSAPAVAATLGSSTMPIYSHFKNMMALEDEVMKKAWDMVMKYQTRYYTGDVWVDQAIGWIRFSRDENNLFKAMLNNNNQELQFEMQEQHWRYLAELLEGYEGFRGMDEQLSQRIRYSHGKLTHGLATSPMVGLDKIIVENDKILFRYLSSASQVLLKGYQEVPPVDETFKKFVREQLNKLT